MPFMGSRLPICTCQARSTTQDAVRGTFVRGKPAPTLTMQPKTAVALCLAAAGLQAAEAAKRLVSAAGQAAAIPSWDLQSSSKAGGDLAALSKTGVDTSSWHHVAASKCTLMGCLVQSGVYDDTQLFFSDNLSKVDSDQFLVPWLYRNEFALDDPAPGKHYFLKTHGITSRADIFLNGKQVADKSVQAGAYGGHTYDITSFADRKNAIVIRAYPTSYYYDFAIGWVDWNYWPNDNGTGVWRDVEVKQTGSVALGPLRVVTQLDSSLGAQPANVTLKSKAQNLETTAVTVTATGSVTPASGGDPVAFSKKVTIPALSTVDIVLGTAIKKPAIWWPKQWGDQPLYLANLTVSTADGDVSDSAGSQFGFRTVTSQYKNNDTMFIVNGQPFQVIGGGYAPDIFLRWDGARLESELEYVLDLGFNTIRLEGKNEHPELYDAADRMGVMIMPGWECCDKWEAWSYNNDLAVTTPVWNDADYAIANASMMHEVAMMQTHPSLLMYFIGSDYYPDDRAAPMYLDAFGAGDWQVPVIDSASFRGDDSKYGPAGMKMEGPYDWVPPNYWYDTEPYGSRLGAAYGFNTELSAGVGTPDLSSLKKFLSAADLDDLWKKPSKNLFHMSTATSSFHNRAIYNNALWKRLGAPTSLEDYVQKAQISDYEANRAQFEGYSSLWSAKRPATGVIYWMLTGAYPSLHWNVWDYYMHPAGGYFGAKAGSRQEHVTYDYVRQAVYLVNHSLGKTGPRTVDIQVIDTAGKLTYSGSVAAATAPNASKNIASLKSALGGIKDVVFLRLVLSDTKSGAVLSRNVYWLAKTTDVLDWDNSDWFVTPVTTYSDYTALNRLAAANVTVTAAQQQLAKSGPVTVTLENLSAVPAFFVSLNLVDKAGHDVVPLTWSDNYVTLWPKEKLTLTATPIGGASAGASVLVTGKNVAKQTVAVS
ncbi:glycoside hydrolase superfamily [Lasiosphaeria miniovina]|uniref:Glycoside hydrolase superfamily n=1 Tax=Lasiosphaeria miniovina TaxID=1954250 RepID=A0AA40ADZ6_9PEZI|nr:glycoside hydrolase superfamily [Lasiosphaeria miniovina]KAK0714091.1 glycoside hydrolase superfamily [Lasiosphaeria miniovina]